MKPIVFAFLGAYQHAKHVIYFKMDLVLTQPQVLLKKNLSIKSRSDLKTKGPCS
jgi:hypothetical protein